MYSLVKFTEDNILYITSTKALSPIDGNLVWAPYKRMGFYEAIVVARNNKRWTLNKLMREKLEEPSEKVERSFDDSLIQEAELMEKKILGIVGEAENQQNGLNPAQISSVVYSRESTSQNDMVTEVKTLTLLNAEGSNDEEVIFEQNSNYTSEHAIEEYFPLPHTGNQSSHDEHDSVHSNYIPSDDTSFLSDEEETNCLEEERVCVEEVAQSICSPQPSGVVNIENVASSDGRPKKYFCKYCHKMVTKIARHLENVHKNEKEVQAFSRLPKGCAERQEIIKLLRGAGSFVYNANACFNTGNLQVTRRPQSSKNRTANHYIVCPRCKNFYSKISIRKHARRCLKTDKRERSIMVMGRRVRSEIHQDACDTMKNQIFPYMRHDEIINLIKYDELVIKFFNEQCLKYRSQHHHKMLRSQIRLVGRFLMKLAENDSSITNFSTVFLPKNFNKVLEVISGLGQYDETKNVMSKPNVPLSIGTLLKKMAKFYKSNSILKEDPQGQKNAEDFLSLIDTHFNPHIGQTVLESKLYFSRQKKQEIPLDEDVHKFIFYLLRNIKLRFDDLTKKYEYCTWLELASFCLMWIISFNRRRVGEVERMKIIDFQNFQRIDKYADTDIYNSLSLEGKQAAENFIRIQLRGKLGRTVPLLLCKLVFKCIVLILDHRKDALVPEENSYVFGLPGKERENYIKGCLLLREHSEKCGAKYPHLLRGTKLRKHIATKSVMLNLNDQEVSDLANYMGHSETVHKSHYRLPIVAREISELSKILLKAQGAEQNELNISSGMHSSTEQLLEGSFTDMNLDIGAQSTPYTSKKQKTASMFLPSDKKVHWTSSEKEAATKFFKSHISMSRTPKLQECFDAIEKCDALEGRSPQAIKTWINSKIKEKTHMDKSYTSMRQRWTSPEVITLGKHFAENYSKKTLPTLYECKEAIKKYSILRGRTPEIIKAKINNDIRKNKE